MFIYMTGSGDRGCSPVRASVVGESGGPPLQCQSRPRIAAKKRVHRRKTQIRDKTIEKYTSISSDGGGGGGGASGTARWSEECGGHKVELHCF